MIDVRAMVSPIRVALADDHRLVREGLCALLAREADIEVVGTACDGVEAVRLARDACPDVLVTDVNMPGMNGLEAIRRIHAHAPTMRLLCVSMLDDRRMVMAVLQAGAAGYLLKDSSCEELSVAIRKVMAQQVYLSPELVTGVVDEMRTLGEPATAAGETPLTPRERELVQLVSEGFSTTDIAERLHVSVKTVATHRENLMQKLSVYGVAGLTRYALRSGLSSLETPCQPARRTRRHPSS